MKLFTVLLSLIFAIPALAGIKTEEVTYTHEFEGKTVTLKGFLAYDDAKAVSGASGATSKRPGIMVVHEWWGLNDYAKGRAKQLAELGYVAFACDMFGDGQTTTDPKQAGAWAGQFQGKDALRIGRLNAGLDILRKHAMVDATRLGSMGYCFGGTSSMALACSGAEGLKAVVSFHGSLWDLTSDQASGIKCKMLICNGSMDTAFIPMEQRNKFIGVLDQAKVDYQFIEYGGAVHSFTNPGADAFKIPGVAYNANADKRSWEAMKRMWEEAFGQKAK